MIMSHQAVSITRPISNSGRGKTLWVVFIETQNSAGLVFICMIKMFVYIYFLNEHTPSSWKNKWLLLNLSKYRLRSCLCLLCGPCSHVIQTQKVIIK